MRVVEIKFLFEGIIFPSRVFIERISDSLNRWEFTISFFTKYLISKYRECYFFVLENNKFKSVYTKDEKEDELVKILQEVLAIFIAQLSKAYVYQKEVFYEEDL